MVSGKVKRSVKRLFNVFGLDIGKIDEYEARKYKWLTELSINTVLDIGSHEGEFALEIRGFLPHASIYSIEPIKDIYTKMNDKCSGLEDFRSYNVAIGDFNGTSMIHKSTFSQSSSILAMSELLKKAFPYTSDISEEEIWVRKLDDFVIDERIDLKPELLIKIDVQGYEDKVIRGGLNTVSMARVVLMEVTFQEMYKEQMLFEPINELIKSLGFKFHGLYNIGFNPDNGLPLYGDAIYLRREK